jgi:cell fate (sporulation/competence/biofilm development) regulator YlbF (YheA/YmcA/DUF963 family)
MKSYQLCYTTLGENMNETLLHLTDQTITEFKSSPSYLAVKEAQLKLHDEDVTHLSKTFRTIQEKYLEVKKYGRYHPDLSEVQKAYQSAKIALYTHPLMKAYQTAYQQFQAELDAFTQQCAITISAQIKLGHIPR